MSKDYYNVLGVDKTATKEDIKKAFRQKAHQYHPDKKDGDEAKFKEINEAYQVLGDEEKRQQYDQFGSTFDQQGGFGGGMNWDDFMKYARQGGGGATYSNVDMGDLGDIFSEIFGGGFGFGRRSRKTTQRGHDVEVSLQLDFKEAVFGTEKTIDFHKLMPCEKCHGTGAEPGTKTVDCPECQGQGNIRTTQRTILGNMQTVRDCPACQGQGKKNEHDCHDCQGQGRRKQEVQIPVKIPAGVDNGMTLKMAGQGEAGIKGAQAGDLYIHLQIKPDAEFKRQESDIISTEKITISQAVLGDKIPVKTIDGEVKLKIPAGTSSGQVFKLKGKGVPHFQHYGRGDHLVEIIINIPEKLNRDQKKLLEELKQQGL